MYKSTAYKFASVFDNPKAAMIQANRDGLKAIDLANEALKLAERSLRENKSLLAEFERGQAVIKQVGLDSQLPNLERIVNDVKQNIKSLEKTVRGLRQAT